MDPVSPLHFLLYIEEFLSLVKTKLVCEGGSQQVGSDFFDNLPKLGLQAHGRVTCLLGVYVLSGLFC